jgi:curved DNA-binding protein CbpA
VQEADRADAEVKFKQLTAGHSILSNPDKRRKYDAGRRSLWNPLSLWIPHTLYPTNFLILIFFSGLYEIQLQLYLHNLLFQIAAT